uniref:N-acetyltransferase domain-containing protein n=1 Tax=Entomoneis paludosa TaxID=265537 RepID=A0A7S3DY70_9STRA|mmetsp:Transcript_9370/g.19452  ORF Transcript_9370/g.19452 Transcript_9370/m.19452 type:complete len:700 (+) Transcript_9370:278-2377(+)
MAQQSRKSKLFTVEILDTSNKEVQSPADIGIVCEHWKSVEEKKCHKNQGSRNIKTNWKMITVDFLQKTHEDCRGRTFVARDAITREIVGSISCQLWRGPVPIEVLDSNALSIGTVWGLTATRFQVPVQQALLRAALNYLRHDLSCHKVVAQCPEHSAEETVFLAHGFKHDNMMTLSLIERRGPSQVSDCVVKPDGSCIHITQEPGPEQDSIFVDHWRKMWKDVGIPEEGLVAGMEDLTISFIQSARKDLQYQTILAKESNTNEVVGSLSCQVWQGPCPQIIESQKVGTIWAVYVEPSSRRQGIATALMTSALDYLASIDCQSAILVAASEGGKSVYEQLGFAPNDALVCDFSLFDDFLDTSYCDSLMEKLLVRELDETLKTVNVVDLSSRQIQALLSATSRQLLAAFADHPQEDKILTTVFDFQSKYGFYVNPDNNWFTQNVKRFGKGFNMKRLVENEAALSTKFDKLSGRYDHWTVGNASKVEQYVAQWAKQRLLKRSLESKHRFLDMACGIGLQGQTLRLCGYEGELVGTDISPGMVDRVLYRGCYDKAFVLNANRGAGGLDSSSSDDEEHKYDHHDQQEVMSGRFDTLLCTGAMELLDHEIVLRLFNDFLREGGELWVSFQHDESPESRSGPTEHQNVRGIPRAEAISKLQEAGFRVDTIELCEDTFYTPSPDLNGKLLPVPYLFIVGTKVVGGND